jgi:hypothetical protein
MDLHDFLRIHGDASQRPPDPLVVRPLPSVAEALQMYVSFDEGYARIIAEFERVRMARRR